MIKRRILTIAMILFCALLNAQTYQWAKRLAGSSGFGVNVKRVAAIPGLGVYVCGSFTGTVDFDPNATVSNKTANATDGFLARYDEGGNLVWVFTTDTATNEEFTCVAPHSTTTLSVLERRNTNAFRVRQFDAVTGAALAVSGRFVTTGVINPESIALNTAANEIYVIGSFTGSLSVGSTVHTSAGQSDIFYFRFGATSSNIAGSNFRRFGGTGDEYGHDIHNRSGGLNILVASFTGTAEFFDSNTNPFYITSAGGYDGLLIAAGVNGQIAQPDNVLRIGSTGDDELLSIVAGANNTYEFCAGGYFSGTVDFNGKSAVNSLTSAGGKDGVVAKYNYTNFGGGSAFEYGWANKLGGSADDRVENVSKFSTASNVYFTAALGSGSGTAVQIGAYTASGGAVTFGGLFFPANQTTVNVPRGVVALSTGEVYTSGIFNASTDFDPGAGTSTMVPVSGGNNGFVHKMSACVSATAPTITATRDTVCSSYADTLSVTGALNGNNKWVWYTASCGGTFVDSGSTIIVNPSATATYYVRAEGGCAATGACSAGKTVTVVAVPAAPTVTVSGPQSTCAGVQVSYTATPSNVLAPITYQWRKNGTNISGATGSVYTTSSVANGDVFSCVITGLTACNTTANATSNNITVNVTTSVVPAVTITTPLTTVCNNTNVTFSSTTTNGGPTPTYQWLRNNVPISGATSAVYTANSTILGSSVNITCVVTSSITCAIPQKDTSNALTVATIPNVLPSVTISPTSATACANGSVTFTATPTNGGSSPNYQWKKNGNNISGATSATYTASGVSNGDVFECVMTSNAQCPSPASATSNSVTVTTTAPVTPTITISVPSTSVCSGASVTFSTGITNGGTSPTYQWVVNGSSVPATGSTYTTNSLLNGDVVNCALTSSAGCVTSANAISNQLIMQVLTQFPPTISISANTTSICAGATVSFTSNIGNGGSAPVYQWKKNGTNISGATSSTYSTTTAANNDVYSCALTSNLPCASPNTATSNSVTVTVSPNVTPTVSISTPTTTFCAGTGVTFTATATNGGSSPTYTWKVNGVTQSGSSNTFTTSALNNNDVVSCQLTSSAACVTAATANSNSVTVTVNPIVNAGVSITATQTTICAGSSVTFTATPTNGGTAPTYQWKKNGTNISGATSATYSSSTLAQNDVITCVVTSNANCLGVATATSNQITISVSSTVVPAVTISANNTAICAGGSINFTASPVNGGSNPTYQWKKNGTNISGATSAGYSTTTAANNDVFSCVLTSSAGCASPTTATSNSITISVTANTTPTVTISTPNTTFCAGTSVTFTATVTNGGSTPTYVWKENGVSQGSSGNTHTVSNLSNGDVVTCEVASSATCVTTPNATSNAVTVTVNPIVNAGVSITTTQTTICAGSSVTFTATPTNGGTAPTYQWKKNGTNISGATSATYSSSTLAQNDVITCVVTSNANCLGVATATSNQITISVSSTVVPAVTISANNTAICAGGSINFTASPVNGGSNPTYQWKRNGANISGATSATYTSTSLADNDVISCVLTSSVSCASPTTATSNNITVNINPPFVPSVNITATEDTICETSSVTLTASATGVVASYQWTVNGVNATLGNSIAFTPIGINNGDTVRCIITSAEACASPAQAVSQPIVITVLQAATVSVSIATQQATTCLGSAVSFDATPTNGGSNPTYEWSVNGNQIAASTNSNYTTTALNNGDVVSCILTSSSTCVTSGQATSNSITVNVLSSLTAGVTITAAQPAVCAGQLAEFNAIGVNGGISPLYIWSINGVEILTGSGAPQIFLDNLNNGDTVRCSLTSSESCVTQAEVVSAPLIAVINPLPDVTVTVTGNTLAIPVATTHQWYNCNTGSTVSGASNASYTAIANGSYKVVATTTAGCIDTSDCVNVTSIGIENTESNMLKVHPNPFTEGLTVTATEFKNGFSIHVYNCLGVLVKEATSYSDTYFIQAPELVSGVYFLKLSNGKKTTVTRIEKP